MKNLLRTFAVIAGFALAMPLLAQRGTSPSITNGTHLGYPAASILTPNNMRFGDSAPRGGHRFGSFAAPQVPLRSFNPQVDHRGRRDHHFRNNFVPFYPVYYYDPYLYGYDDTSVESNSYSLAGAGTFNTSQPPASEGNSEYPHYRPYVESNSVIDSQGHIYDRRPERAPEPPSAEAAQPASTASAHDDEVRTLLIFKDGRQLEVSNYAIMGSTLYLFAGDHRKISLADIDLDATRKANDERGTEFRVPNPS